VIQNNKDSEDIRVSVDFRSPNASCVHGPFPTPFSDEMLDQGVGKRHTHSYGFSGYRWGHIAKHNKDKTTFSIV
jgi:hypothetical protein